MGLLSINQFEIGRIFPFKALMEEKLQKRVEIDNDANVAALGEAWCGAGKDVDDLVCVTLGTGVGGGVIVNGQLVYGIERDLLVRLDIFRLIQMVCVVIVDRTGCLETIASATGIARLAKEANRNRENLHFDGSILQPMMYFKPPNSKIVLPKK